MPITFTGRSVKPGAATYPSLVDIAVGLSRQPRFAGQGKRWFSVLDHSLFADEMVKQLPDADIPFLAEPWPNAARAKLRLAVLLHDAHEAITADVPTTFKGEELKYAQLELDRGIMGAFFPGGGDGYLAPGLINLVRHIDRRALAAEARVVGPPVSAERILEAFGVTEDTPGDMQMLGYRLQHQNAWFGVPPSFERQDIHPGVLEYLRRALELL